MDLLIPGHPCLFLACQLRQHLRSLDRIVLSIHGNEIPVKRDGLKSQKNYHDEFGGQSRLGVDLTVKFIVLLYPVNGADWNCDSLVAFRIVIIRNHNFVHLLNDLSGLLLVYLHIRFLINPLHRNHKQLVKLTFDYFFYIFEHGCHTKRVFMIGCNEGRSEQHSVIVGIRYNLSKYTQKCLVL